MHYLGIKPKAFVLLAACYFTCLLLTSLTIFNEQYTVCSVYCTVFIKEQASVLLSQQECVSVYLFTHNKVCWAVLWSNVKERLIKQSLYGRPLSPASAVPLTLSHQSSWSPPQSNSPGSGFREALPINPCFFPLPISTKEEKAADIKAGSLESVRLREPASQ